MQERMSEKSRTQCGRAEVRNTIWQRWDDYVCDPAQEEQGLNSVFWKDRSTVRIIRQFAKDLAR